MFVIGNFYCLVKLPCLVQAFGLLEVLRPHLVYSFSPLADSLMVSHCGLTLTEKKLMFYCNTTSPMLILDSGERWLLNGSLNYYTILQIELFCQRSWNGMKHLMYRCL